MILVKMISFFVKNGARFWNYGLIGLLEPLGKKGLLGLKPLEDGIFQHLGVCLDPVLWTQLTQN